MAAVFFAVLSRPLQIWGRADQQYTNHGPASRGLGVQWRRPWCRCTSLVFVSTELRGGILRQALADRSPLSLFCLYCPACHLPHIVVDFVRNRLSAQPVPLFFELSSKMPASARSGVRRRGNESSGASGLGKSVRVPVNPESAAVVKWAYDELPLRRCRPGKRSVSEVRVNDAEPIQPWS